MSFNPDRINIHELTIEEPEKQIETELSFDVEKDITKDDWEQMNKEMERQRGNYDSTQANRIAMDMRILDPKVNLNMSDSDWEAMRQKIKNCQTNGSWESMAVVAKQMKIFNQDIGINLDDKAKQGMIQELYKKRIQIKTGIHANANFPHKPWSFTDFPKLATEIKITDPNIEFDVNETAWDGMKQELEAFRDDNNWYAFAQQAMQMKILDPNIDLGLNQDAWDGMRSTLKSYGGGTGWIMFSGQAVAMKILAAEEVKVTDKGLEINMRKKKDSLTSDVPPIPEIKKF